MSLLLISRWGNGVMDMTYQGIQNTSVTKRDPNAMKSNPQLRDSRHLTVPCTTVSLTEGLPSTTRFACGSAVALLGFRLSHPTVLLLPLKLECGTHHGLADQGILAEDNLGGSMCLRACPSF